MARQEDLGMVVYPLLVLGHRVLLLVLLLHGVGGVDEHVPDGPVRHPAAAARAQPVGPGVEGPLGQGGLAAPRRRADDAAEAGAALRGVGAPRARAVEEPLLGEDGAPDERPAVRAHVLDANLRAGGDRTGGADLQPT